MRGDAIFVTNALFGMRQRQHDQLTQMLRRTCGAVDVEEEDDDDDGGIGKL
jgi:hypothetical protein